MFVDGITFVLHYITSIVHIGTKLYFIVDLPTKAVQQCRRWSKNQKSFWKFKMLYTKAVYMQISCKNIKCTLQNLN